MVRRYLLVAATLFVLGLLALGYALVGGGLGPWLDRPALLATGLSLLLGGGWQLWALASTQLRAEQHSNALASELEMTASVAQHTRNAAIVTGPDHRIVWVNESFRRVTGYADAQALGQRPGDLLRSPAADPATLARIDAAIAAQAPLDIEVLHRYQDGRDRWVQMLLSPMQHPHDGFRGFVAVLVDIDEKVQIREALQSALRANEALMQTLDAHEIVSETDRHGSITRVNRKFVEISGYTQEELLGRNHRLINSGYHPPEFWRAMWERISQGQPWSGEICNRSKDGRLYWVQSLIAPFLGSDGLVEKYISIRTDITAHKQAAAELRTSQELLARTSRIAGIGGWYADLRTRTLYLSDECRNILHIPPGQAVQLEDLWRRFESPARERARDELQAMARLEQLTVDLEAQIQNGSSGQGGPTQWVRLVGEIDWQGQDTDRLIGAVQDITFQIRTQQRIAEEQRILRSAIDAVGEAFALYDPDDRLVYFNDKYRELVSAQGPVQEGMFFETLVRSAARRGVFEESRGREDAWVAEMMHHHREIQGDKIRKVSDGRWMRFIDQRTSDGYHVVFRIDVTALQDALLAADAAARSKGQFLANMSHEIRTPINAIMGLLQLLGHTALDPQQDELVRKARTAARSLLDILNDILDFSKVEAGKMELHAEPFDVHQLVRELSVILSGALGDKPVELVYDVDARLPPALLGDALRLKQVLINLGGNAIKFTERGRVALRVQQVRRSRNGVQLRFAVEDTGIGIHPDQQRHIFSGFSQAEASTARRYGGTGLGLAISQRLVALMGSELTLQSTPGEGSVFAFEIHLPLADPAGVPVLPAPAPRGAARLAGLRLLLAEDNALNREVALAMLRREGAEVTVAVDGREAVQALERAPGGHDLVLMDVQMPVLDGLQATREIRGRLQLRDLPIMAMTANAMQSDREQCAEAGMNAHMGKPFELDELVVQILRLTGRAAGPALPPAQAPSGPVAAAVLESVAALRRLGGDAVLLRRLRQGFAQAAPAQLTAVRQTVAQEDAATAAGLLHQLKSSAAAVGVEILARACADAEQALRAGAAEACRGPVLQAVEAAGAAALAALAQWLAGQAEPAPAPLGMDADDLQVALQHLKDLLDRADMEAIEQHDRLLARHAPAQGADFAALNQAMERLDFVAAAVEAARLMQQAGLPPAGI